jgi:hypothetical protein
MARPRKLAGKKVTKRKKVTVQLIEEKHAGKVTEPYRLLKEMQEINHRHLDNAKIGLAWRLGWRANTDGQLQLAACRKRGDLDRELDGFDFIILLNREAFAVLNEESKRALIDHQLCHAQITMDADGNPKMNDRDRLVCRVRKHDVEEFRVIVERHGAWTQDLAKMAQAAINDASRPLLKFGEAAEASDNGEGETADAGDAGTATKLMTKKQWRKTPLSDVIDNPRFVDALHNAGLDDCGDLQDRMKKVGLWWSKDVAGVGEVAKTKIEDAFNAYAAEHPEAAG